VDLGTPIGKGKDATKFLCSFGFHFCFFFVFWFGCRRRSGPSIDLIRANPTMALTYLGSGNIIAILLS